MIISDLHFCENLVEGSDVAGGSCSLSAKLVNGKPYAKSKGCPLKKKTIKKGSSTTYIFTAGSNKITLTSGKDSEKYVAKTFSNVKTLLNNLL